MRIIESTPEYKVYEDDVYKLYRSDEANYDFNKRDGVALMWGKTVNDDPIKFPSPNILDLEITTRCTGINGKVCAYCFPAGTKITMQDGSQKNIENIKAGDKVKSYTGSFGKAWKENKVIETYERDYDGDLVCLELENGDYIEVTPNHPILTSRGWVSAGNLKEDDNIITFNNRPFKDMIYKCDNCGKFIKPEEVILDKDAVNSKSYKGFHVPSFCSKECMNEYDKSRMKICPGCGKEFKVIKGIDIFCKECIDSMFFPGSRNHHLWNLYSSMIQRCFNPKNGSYKYYGAVGKIPDKRWMSFRNFLDDMEDSWFPGASLDRIDNNKGYSKDNCRWVTKDEQRTNRRKFKDSKTLYKHIYQIPSGSYFVGGPEINGDKGSKAFPTLEEALEYRNNRYKEKYPETYEMYIKE